jgi:hypothetical protein
VSTPDPGVPQTDVELPVFWVGVDEMPTTKINQYIVQIDSGGDTFLTVGTLTPPLLTADNPEEMRKQAEAIGFVPIRGVAKFSLSAKGVRELVQVLQNGLRMLEQQEAQQ